MDKTSEHNMLQIRISGDVDSLTPHYLLQWLDYTNDQEFRTLADVALSFLELSECVTVYFAPIRPPISFFADR